jgi:hypothetical protein
MTAIEARGHAYLSVPRARQIGLIWALQPKIGDQLPAMQNGGSRAFSEQSM